MLVKEGIIQDTLAFNRTVRPASTVKAPSLIGFLNGSSVAMAGAVYIRWMCFKDKSKVIEGNLSNSYSQDSDFNPEIHILSLHWLHLKLEWLPWMG